MANRSSPSSMPRQGRPSSYKIAWSSARRQLSRPQESNPTWNVRRNCSANIRHNSVLPVPDGPITRPAPSSRMIPRVRLARAASIAPAGKYPLDLRNGNKRTPGKAETAAQNHLIFPDLHTLRPIPKPTDGDPRQPPSHSINSAVEGFGIRGLAAREMLKDEGWITAETRRRGDYFSSASLRLCGHFRDLSLIDYPSVPQPLPSSPQTGSRATGKRSANTSRRRSRRDAGTADVSARRSPARDRRSQRHGSGSGSRSRPGQIGSRGGWPGAAPAVRDRH